MGAVWVYTGNPLRSQGWKRNAHELGGYPIYDVSSPEVRQGCLRAWSNAADNVDAQMNTLREFDYRSYVSVVDSSTWHLVVGVRDRADPVSLCFLQVAYHGHGPGDGAINVEVVRGPVSVLGPRRHHPAYCRAREDGTVFFELRCQRFGVTDEGVQEPSPTALVCSPSVTVHLGVCVSEAEEVDDR